MTSDNQKLFEFLDARGIGHVTHTHPAIFTVEQGRDIKASIPGAHTKNLFLKDKAGQLFLICALGETSIALGQLHKVIGSKRLSFASPELMAEHLGVTPGSVTLFALINDKGGAVRLVIDKALLDYTHVNFHPLFNTATTTISAQDMLGFAKACGHTPQIVDFKALS